MIDLFQQPVESRASERNKIHFGTVNFRKTEYINTNLLVMLTNRIFLETAGIKIPQLIPFSFFPKQIRLFSSSVIETTYIIT